MKRRGRYSYVLACAGDLQESVVRQTKRVCKSIGPGRFEESRDILSSVYQWFKRTRLVLAARIPADGVSQGLAGSVPLPVGCWPIAHAGLTVGPSGEVVAGPVTPSSTSRRRPFLFTPFGSLFRYPQAKVSTFPLLGRSRRRIRTSGTKAYHRVFLRYRVTSKWLSARTRGCLRERRESRRRRSTLSRERVRRRGGEGWSKDIWG